jgi:hypothetical protein
MQTPKQIILVKIVTTGRKWEHFSHGQLAVDWIGFWKWPLYRALEQVTGRSANIALLTAKKVRESRPSDLLGPQQAVTVESCPSDLLGPQQAVTIDHL